MQIIIKNLTFLCIVGILENERITPQKVIVNLKVTYDYDGENFINYAKLCEYIENDMQEIKYFLLEDAISSLLEKIKYTYPKIEKMTIEILKPDILQNAVVGLKKKVIFEKN